MTLFISYHLIIWYLFTSKIFSHKDAFHIGDLARMSYQINMIHERETILNLDKQHIRQDSFTNQKIDILTIGDSFSNGIAAGLNPFYQDYLATYSNKNILNISPEKPLNAFETIVALYNSGYIEKLKPKAIIVESVERKLPQRYIKEIDFTIKSETTLPHKTLLNKKRNQENYKNIKILDSPEVSIINTANYKFPFYTIKYHYNNNAQRSVYKFRLNKKLFSISNGYDILIYHQDIKYIEKFTPQNVNKINKNFNQLAILLKKLDIKLFFMPAVDKYDLYYEYIINNQYPKNNFFDLIRPLNKKYYFIDTKQILSPYLEQNIQDIFYIDDTHWSYVASDIISKRISAMLREDDE